MTTNTDKQILLANTVVTSFLVSVITIAVSLAAGVLLTFGVAIDAANTVGQISTVVAMISILTFFVSMFVLVNFID